MPETVEKRGEGGGEEETKLAFRDFHQSSCLLVCSLACSPFLEGHPVFVTREVVAPEGGKKTTVEIIIDERGIEDVARVAVRKIF